MFVNLSFIWTFALICKHALVENRNFHKRLAKYSLILIEIEFFFYMYLEFIKFITFSISFRIKKWNNWIDCFAVINYKKIHRKNNELSALNQLNQLISYQLNNVAVVVATAPSLYRIVYIVQLFVRNTSVFLLSLAF